MTTDTAAADLMKRATAIAEEIFIDPQGDTVMTLFQQLRRANETDDQVRNRLASAVARARAIVDTPPQRAIMAIFERASLAADVQKGAG
jgi:ABC-type Fe2+-enterobactin transport system substrate-binding protein